MAPKKCKVKLVIVEPDMYASTDDKETFSVDNRFLEVVEELDKIKERFFDLLKGVKKIKRVKHVFADELSDIFESLYIEIHTEENASLGSLMEILKAAKATAQAVEQVLKLHKKIAEFNKKNAAAGKQ